MSRDSPPCRDKDPSVLLRQGHERGAFYVATEFFYIVTKNCHDKRSFFHDPSFHVVIEVGHDREFLCRDRVFLCRDRVWPRLRGPAATGYLSVTTGFGQTLHYIVTRLGEHNRGKCFRDQDYYDRYVVLR